MTAQGRLSEVAQHFDPLEGLRPYQIKAARAIVSELRKRRSTLLVLPTGTGKTQVFVGLASQAHGRVLILAHRDELVQQAANRIEQMTGEAAGIEKAERTSKGERFVVASVQTLHERRLSSLPPDSFGLVVVDEAHHCAAPTYKAILTHFAGAKILGVTATPDRTDRQALGKVFESVAYEYSTWDAIDDKWLVAPKLLRIILESVDLAGVRSVAGDLHQGQLEEQMGAEAALHGIARPLLDLTGDRKTLVFMPGVDSAHALAKVLDGQRPGSARALDGTTPMDERRRILADHSAGEYQYLVNCMVLTEGFDSPAVSCIAVARPTKSRSLYAQMLGRGLRLSEGKADCLLIDFVDVSRRHDLAGPLDVLGQADSDEVVSEARKEVGGGIPGQAGEEVNLCAVLLRARSKVEYRAKQEELRRSRSGVGRKTVAIDVAWGLFGLDLSLLTAGARWGLRPATEAQLRAIRASGVGVEDDLSAQAASVLVGVITNRRRDGLASPAQLQVLARHGLASPALTLGEAGEYMGRLAANRWRRDW